MLRQVRCSSAPSESSTRWRPPAAISIGESVSCRSIPRSGAVNRYSPAPAHRSGPWLSSSSSASASRRFAMSTLASLRRLTSSSPSGRRPTLAPADRPAQAAHAAVVDSAPQRRTDRLVTIWIDECLSPWLAVTVRDRGYESTCNVHRDMFGAADAELFRHGRPGRLDLRHEQRGRFHRAGREQRPARRRSVA
jgi:hypothetical protein